jgi:TfoX/Sxy family transcriptional regulator of competence genes
VAAAEAAFASLVERLTRDAEVEQKTAFHSPGLTVHGKIFAMLVRGELVLKLPADRCADLAAAGAARPFETGGRAMREWVVLGDGSSAEWDALADEALGFVR